MGFNSAFKGLMIRDSSLLECQVVSTEFQLNIPRILTLKMITIHSLNTSVTIYQSTRRTSH